MKNDKKLFTHYALDKLTVNTKFNDMHISAALAGSNIMANISDVDILTLYLESLGFNSDKHYIDDGILAILSHSVKSYADDWCTYGKNIVPLERLLTPYDNRYGAPFDFTDDKSTLQDLKIITSELYLVLNTRGLIYPLEPKHYHFKVITHDDGSRHLVIKYNQIIGGRKIARIK